MKNASEWFDGWGALHAGLGSRFRMFTTAILHNSRDHCNLVGFCDYNETQIDYYNHHCIETLGTAPIPIYKPDQFDQMLEEQRLDTIIVNH